MYSRASAMLLFCDMEMNRARRMSRKPVVNAINPPFLDGEKQCFVLLARTNTLFLVLCSVQKIEIHLNSHQSISNEVLLAFDFPRDELASNLRFLLLATLALDARFFRLIFLSCSISKSSNIFFCP